MAKPTGPAAMPSKGAPVPTRPVTAPTPEDLDLAKEDALLQLRIGRASHYYTVLVSVALMIDAGFVLAFPPPLRAGSFAFANLFFLLIPIGSGVFLSIFALRIKWDEYQLWPWETHFWVTVLAVVLNLFVGYVYVAGLLALGPTANWSLVPGLLPLALGGLSAAMAGLALTWTSRSQMQLASLVSALVPFGFGFILFVPGLPPSARVGSLATALVVCAFFYQTSGSFLHLISSGTRAHEREVITSGQTRMFVVADDLRRREASVELREAALREREALVEDESLSLKRKLEAQAESRQHLDAVEAEIQNRSKALTDQQSTWAAQSSAANAAQRAVDEKELDLKRREEELAARSTSVGEREQRVVAAEGEVAKREVELARLHDDATRRLRSLEDAERALATRRIDLDRRTTEVLQKEAQLRSQATMAEASAQERSSQAQRLADLEDREARLQQLQIALDELKGTVARQAQENGAAATALNERQERQAVAESELASRGAALDQREAAMSASVRLAESRQAQYEALLRELGDRSKEADRRAAEVQKTLAELQRRESEASERELRLQQREATAADREATLDRRERERRERARLDAAAPPAAAPAEAPAPEIAPEAGTAGPMAVPPRRVAGRVSLGAPRFDDLLLGGLPPKGQLLLAGPPFTGKEVLLYQFLAEGLKRGEPVVIVTAGRPQTEVAEGLSKVLPDFADRNARGQVLWIDAAGGAGSPGAATTSASAPRSTEPSAILSALVQASRKAEATHPDGFRVGVLGLAQLVAGLEGGRGGPYFQNLVGVLRPRNALATFALDTGLLPEPVVAALESHVDGVVEFREDRGKSLLAVRGLGDVATRDWVEYRVAPQGLQLGSFALERIR